MVLMPDLPGVVALNHMKLNFEWFAFDAICSSYEAPLIEFV